MSPTVTASVSAIRNSSVTAFRISPMVGGSADPPSEASSSSLASAVAVAVAVSVVLRMESLGEALDLAEG